MSAMIDFRAERMDGDLDVRWIHGHPAGRRDTDPPLQAHAFDPHTVILRQSMAVHHEAPFMYLLFGNARAMLVDTGATPNADRFPLRNTVDAIIDRWRTWHPRTEYELVVAHTHAHADHVAGDAQFAGRPATVVVPADADGMRSFFGLGTWPDGHTSFDLGGRELEVVPCPGHHEAAIAIFDAWTGFLLTGDTVYPGRLFVSDMPAYLASLDRLVAFAAKRPVSHVMGGHIEMTRRAGRDHPMGAVYQPDEPPLQMTPQQLLRVRQAAALVANRRGAHASADVIVVHRPGISTMLRMAARSIWHRLGRLRLWTGG